MATLIWSLNTLRLVLAIFLPIFFPIRCEHSGLQCASPAGQVDSANSMLNSCFVAIKSVQINWAFISNLYRLAIGSGGIKHPWASRNIRACFKCLQLGLPYLPKVVHQGIKYRCGSQPMSMYIKS